MKILARNYALKQVVSLKKTFTFIILDLKKTFELIMWPSDPADEMDCGVEQIDGPARTCSPSCEQRDAGREGQAGTASRHSVHMGQPRIKLPKRSDMICSFASLKGQRICKFLPFFLLFLSIFSEEICLLVKPPWKTWRVMACRAAGITSL